MEFTLSQGVAVLERTPGTLRAMLAGLRPEWARATEGPETWSPYDRLTPFRESEGKSLSDLLDEFTRLRTQNLATLAGWHLTAASLTPPSSLRTTIHMPSSQ